MNRKRERERESFVNPWTDREFKPDR